MALYRADEHLSHGRISEAKAALEFAIEHYKEAETHVKELLEKLKHADSVPSISVVSPFEKNREVLVERFPAVAQAIRGSELPDSFSIRHGASGAPVVVWENTPLDQVDKPVRAAELWAEQTIARVRGAKSVLVVGFGGGYGIEALQQRTDAEIHLAVPDPRFLHAAMIARDCTTIFKRIRSISLSVEALRQAFSQGECPEVVIHPQALLYAPSFVDEVRVAVQGRGMRSGTAANLEGMAKELHADPLRSIAPKLVFGNKG
jgi:hypothetical protein